MTYRVRSDADGDWHKPPPDSSSWDTVEEDTVEETSTEETTTYEVTFGLDWSQVIASAILIGALIGLLAWWIWR